MIKTTANTIKPSSGFTIINGSGTIYSKKQVCIEIGAIYARANSESFAAPDALEKWILNDFIRHEKQYGLFQKMDLSLMFCHNQTEMSNFSRINLKNPEGNLATIHGGMTYTANGWKGNGVDGYIDTGFNPASDTNHYTLNNACRAMVVYSTGSGALDGVDGNNANRLYLSSTVSHRINTATALATAVNMTGAGLKVIGKTNAADSYFINKTIHTTQVQPSGAIYNGQQIIFKSATTNYSSAGLSTYMAGAAITYSQAQSHRANVNNLMKKFGLNPIA